MTTALSQAGDEYSEFYRIRFDREELDRKDAI